MATKRKAEPDWRMALKEIEAMGLEWPMHDARAPRFGQTSGQFDRRSLQNRAGAVVGHFVRLGLLPKANTLTCVDCGERGGAWDHRDYAKPLAVEPVCFRCNMLRGPAEPTEGRVKPAMPLARTKQILARRKNGLDAQP